MHNVHGVDLRLFVTTINVLMRLFVE